MTIRLSCAAMASVAVLAGCGVPQQARFTVGPCEPAVAGGFEDLAWTVDPEPVLEPGPPGAWDSVDALNPSVVRFRGEFLKLYSGFDGRTWRTGLAASPDGASWTKSGEGPLIEPDPATWEGDSIAANGATVARGGELLHWYQAGPRHATRIGLARSADGRAWRKTPHAVLGPGARGAWDEAAVGDPYALACGEWIYLYYLGQNRRGVQRLGLARSRDGLRWQRSHLNPLLEPGGPGAFDERGLGEPAVLFAAGEFWMLYTGRAADERRRLGWARSADGVVWRKSNRPGPIAGAEAWNEAVICDAEFVVRDGRLEILFGAGDRPSPDENLNGRIGVARPAVGDSR